MNEQPPHEHARVLEVSGVRKCYRSYNSELQRIATWFGYQAKPKEEQWVLDNISFSLLRGETVGIVGQNGAGKSTLLKIIVGTLKPSGGRITINGRVSAILELGMGFHPDLTGRQNVYHSAGLMGFSKEQIENAIESIADFAEIGDYFDQPVRTYSSGMQMRLAFSVVTMYRPEILIVDEALSVGDVYFQHKSFNLIRQFRDQGTTLLLVSHDRAAVQSICTRAILLDAGMILRDGPPEEVMDYYNALIADKQNKHIEQKENSEGQVQTISGTGEAEIVNVTLQDENGQQLEVASVGQKVELVLQVSVHENIPELVAGFVIRDRLGIDVFGTNSHHLNNTLKNIDKGTRIQFSYKFPVRLGTGSYSITVALHADYTHLAGNYHWCDRVAMFSVVNTSSSQFTGLAWLPVDLEIDCHE